MKHISLDREDQHVQQFFRALPLDPDGSILELQGEAVMRVFPVGDDAIDRDELKAAILGRCQESSR